MNFKKFMELYDDWNKTTKVNDANFNTIIEAQTYVIMDTRPDLFDKKVMAFGFYDGVLTVRVK